MKDKYKQLWIRLEDWKALRRAFPAFEGETLVNYFERLRKQMEKESDEFEKREVMADLYRKYDYQNN